MAIKRMFGIGRLNVEWTLPSRLSVNPLVWKVEVNDELVDIRQESREKQEAAYRKGLIPWIPADREEGKVVEEPTAASAESDLVEGLFGLYQKIRVLLRQSSLDEENLKLLPERIDLVMQKLIDEMERTQDWNLAGRLDSAYGEIRNYAEELSSKQGGEKAGK